MVKEFEKLPKLSSYKYFEDIQKDAWNAAIKWAAENAEADWDGNAYVWVHKQSILKGLIE